MIYKNDFEDEEKYKIYFTHGGGASAIYTGKQIKEIIDKQDGDTSWIAEVYNINVREI